MKYHKLKMSKETTLVLFKTDCVQNKLVGEILNRFEEEQFTIRGMKMIELSTELLEVQSLLGFVTVRL